MINIATVEKTIGGSYKISISTRTTSFGALGKTLEDSIKDFYGVVEPYGINIDNLVFQIPIEVCKGEQKWGIEKK